VAGGPGGPAKATRVALAPCAVSFGNGELYVTGTGSVQMVSPATGHLTPMAGTGVPGPLGDGGPAASASLSAFDESGKAVVDHAGNLVIAASGQYRVRVVAHRTGTFYGQPMTAGDIYTIAGDGDFGHSGNGGPATAAELGQPDYLALDHAGNVLINDRDSNQIRLVAASTGTFYGQPMTAGDIYSIAGVGGVEGYSGDGGPATQAQLSFPWGVAVDRSSNVVIDDTDNQRIRVVAHRTGTFYGRPMKAGDIYTVAYPSYPVGMTVDSAGNLLFDIDARVQVLAENTGTYYRRPMTAGHIYTIAGNGSYVYSGDGGPANSAGIAGPCDVALDSAGNVLIADVGDRRVRLVAESTGTFYGVPMRAGDIYTIAGNGSRTGTSGDGGLATVAQFQDPTSVAADHQGNLLIAAAASNRVRMVAESTGTFYGRPMSAGDIYTVAGGGSGGLGDGGPGTAARLDDPRGVAADGAGNALIADAQHQRIRVVAAASGTFYGQAMTAGDIYTLAGNGKPGYAGDGGPATAAELNAPQGVAVDGAGNVVIADSGNQRVRVVAAASGTFYGQAMTAGDIYTLAGNGKPGFSGDGGPATAAELNGPGGVAADGAGNVVIADSGNQRVRVVAAASGTFYGQAMTAGDIYTLAGDGDPGFSGDGGPATSATLTSPANVAVDGAGNVVIADSGNNRVRVVAAASGTFYGQAMTAGDIYTLAGDGDPGFSGDGGPATAAELNGPEGVAADGAGGVLIADTGSWRVREVAG
jgi:hypothetical protein